jgi:putative peptide maturation dehydrogenase
LARVRRTRFLFFHPHDVVYPDIDALLGGEIQIRREEVLLAISVLASEEVPLRLDDLELIVSIPVDRWVEVDAESWERLDRFVRAGVLLSDGDDPVLAELRARDETLTVASWNVYAALYYSIMRWRDIDTEEPPEGDPELMLEESYREFVSAAGAAPTHFYRAAPGSAAIELPLQSPDGPFYDLLLRRRSTRSFDPSTPLPLTTLGTILYYAFGCQGVATYAGGALSLVRKTSPSGGGLHPVEVYPLILRVEGVDPGIYHYAIEDHTLEQLQILSLPEAEEWTSEFTMGQRYFGSAQALFVLTVRFDRAQWKYRNDDRIVASASMDAAHLSQTFYLLCEEVGLGACITAALNVENIEARLGLEVFREGVLAICACGSSGELDPSLHPAFVAHRPRTSS